MNKYPLNLSPDYCSDWTPSNAIRELLQNALDDPSTFQYGFDDDTLHITSVGVELPLRTLLLGNTTKSSESDSVGGFGEGYKIAMLVLVREGYDVTIYNGSKIWTPVYEYCDTYESDVLTVLERELHDNSDLTFIIDGIDEDLKEEIIDSCLYLQGDLGEVLEGSRGRVLLDRPNKLYVGGLYVTDTQMNYSYDFHPSVLKLNRDRQAVSGWDLSWATGSLWNEVSDSDTRAEMLFEKCPDVEYVKYTSTSSLKKSCYDLYVEKYGEVPIASDSMEKEEMERKGLTNVVVTGNEQFNTLVKDSSEYQSLDFEEEDELSPCEMLEELLESATRHDWDEKICNLIGIFEDRGVAWET